MAHRNRPQASSLFLLELILAILFFSLASAVCVRFFVKARMLSIDSQELNMAVYESSGIAEVIGSSGSREEAEATLSSLYPNAEAGEDSFTVYYDGQFQECPASEALYSVCAAFSGEEGMLIGNIESRNLEDSELIYSLAVEHYTAGRQGSVSGYAADIQ